MSGKRAAVASALLAALAWGAPAAAEEPAATPLEVPAPEAPTVETSAPEDPATRYDACLAQTEIDPRAALTAAENWQAAGGGVPAGHCAALALIALGENADAGTLLLSLANADPTADGLMRAALYGQAGNAFLLAAMPDNARTALSRALELNPGDPVLLADRARGAMLETDWEAARADLDQAILLAPDRIEAYPLRAQVRRQQGDMRGARDDIDAALRRDPGNPQALFELAMLKLKAGDRAGAKADLEAVVAGARDPSVTAAAQQELAELP